MKFIITTALAAMLATSALAEGHDQGSTDSPGGKDARAETAETAHDAVGKDSGNISDRGKAARAQKGAPSEE